VSTIALGIGTSIPRRKNSISINLQSNFDTLCPTITDPSIISLISLACFSKEPESLTSESLIPWIFDDVEGIGIPGSTNDVRLMCDPSTSLPIRAY
tara:strand:+ start:1305 stop:1592 length:288 start_codon:yes stop_codon:yes gene_type:complete